MAYLINPEDQDLLDSVREFCEKEIKEQCKEYDVSGEWPEEIYAKAAELGYNGLEVPEEYGGLGLERITVAAIMEEFAKADAGFVTTITASNLALKAVLIGGNEEQKQRCCDLLMEGKHGAFCLTEPMAGSDAGNSKTTAVREGDEYANWRAHLRARYGKIDAPVKIDITTEDEIVPGRIEYRYPLMFEEGSVRVLSYPLETVLAEKLETVVSRGIANTRGRDYYDIHTLLRLKAGEINRDSLHEAVVATASRRGSLGTMGDYEAVLGEVRRSDMMRGIWSSYVSASPYAEGHKTRGRRSRTRSNTSSSTTAGRGCAHRSAITPRAT